MIIDIHTHPPRYRDPVPDDQAEYNSVWRPDRPVKTTTSWADYLEAQKPAERSVAFGIAPRPGEADDAVIGRYDWSDGNVDQTGTSLVTVTSNTSLIVAAPSVAVTSTLNVPSKSAFGSTVN